MVQQKRMLWYCVDRMYHEKQPFYDNAKYSQTKVEC
jgi:hypothetical protein